MIISVLGNNFYFDNSIYDFLSKLMEAGKDKKYFILIFHEFLERYKENEFKFVNLAFNNTGVYRNLTKIIEELVIQKI